MNLPRRTYALAAVQASALPLLLAGALALSVAAGARAGLHKWVEWLSPLEDCWDWDDEDEDDDDWL